MSRHASVHAAGVVIAPGPITDYAPLYKGARDEITTQWNMKEVERVGLLKMDFLGLSTLTLIQDCLAEIKRTEGIALDIDAIPLDDPKTYKVFGEGAAFGIFQFESSGMRELLRKAKPERLDDLIALNALYRPGPLKSGMVDDWVARKQGRTEVKYELPQLEPILSDTYGVIAYQEQVMRIAQALAGFTLGQADVLRKAMGKKDPKVMAKQREAFMEGARAKGINEKKATKIFELMEYFAGYGFNKSHSTAYAFLAYQTAYLKANYPWHFAAALLTIEAQNTDKLAMYLAESQRARHPGAAARHQREPAALLGGARGRGVRFGLTAIKGLGEGAIQTPSSMRATTLGGRIPSLHALCEILDLRLANKRVFEALVKSGACDSLVDCGTDECRSRPLERRSGPGSLRRSTAPASTAADAAEQGPRPGRSLRWRRRGRRRADDRAAAGCAAVDRDRAAAPTRRSRSGSSGAVIRSIATRTTCATTARRRLPTSLPRSGECGRGDVATTTRRGGRRGSPARPARDSAGQRQRTRGRRRHLDRRHRRRACVR